MREIRNLKGQRFGHLVVLEQSNRRLSANIQWLCQCDCGKKLIVRGDNLTTGHTTQCSVCKPQGCRRSAFVEEGMQEHGTL